MRIPTKGELVPGTAPTSHIFPKWSAYNAVPGFMTLKIHNYNGQNKAIELNTSTVYGVMKYNTEYTMPVDGYIWFSSVNPGLESTLSLVAIKLCLKHHKHINQMETITILMFITPATTLNS